MPDFNGKMHQNRFQLGPRPRGGAYSTPQTPWLDLRGPISKGRGGERGEGRSTCLPPRFDNPGYGPEDGSSNQLVEPVSRLAKGSGANPEK